MVSWFGSIIGRVGKSCTSKILRIAACGFMRDGSMAWNLILLYVSYCYISVLLIFLLWLN